MKWLRCISLLLMTLGQQRGQRRSSKLYRVGSLYHTKDQILKDYFLPARESNSDVGDWRVASVFLHCALPWCMQPSKFQIFAVTFIDGTMIELLTASPFAFCASIVFCPSNATEIIISASYQLITSTAGQLQAPLISRSVLCRQLLWGLDFNCGTSTILFRQPALPLILHPSWSNSS